MLKQSCVILRRMNGATASEFAVEMGLEMSNAHHRLTRMVGMGLAKAEGKYPTVYRVVG